MKQVLKLPRKSIGSIVIGLKTGTRIGLLLKLSTALIGKMLTSWFDYCGWARRS
jgi:hypothetical protein